MNDEWPMYSNSTIIRRKLLITLGIGVFYSLAYYHATIHYRWIMYAYSAAIISFVWVPQVIRARYMVVLSLLATIGCIVAVKIFGINADLLSNLLIPFVGFLAGSRRVPRRLSFGITLFITATFIFIDPNNLWISFLFPTMGVYAGIYGLRIRRDAQFLDRRRTQELEVAYAALQQAHMELQTTTMHAMQSAALAERARLARDIHDGLGHHLTSLIISLQSLEFMLPQNPLAAEQQIPQMLTIAREALAEVRCSVQQWTSDDSLLNLSAMRGLIHQVAEQSGLHCDFIAPDQISDWDTNISITLFRVLQEACTNVLRHAQASHIRVEISEVGQHVFLQVNDDGIHTADQPLIPGFGLKSMEQRCIEVGGTFTIAGHAPHGLIIKAGLPWHGDDEMGNV